MRRAFYTLDVFADKVLAGNPLAVVIDAAGLDDAKMQSVAREFNLSETVFVLEPRDPINTAALRIFTPGRELPFAGHPTVGTAVLLAHLRARDLLSTQDLRLVLEGKVGDVVCIARHRRGAAMAAYFHLPRLPEQGADSLSAEELADGLGLSVADIGFDNHRPVVMNAGTPMQFAPLASLDAVARARPDRRMWGENGGAAVYLYCRQTLDPKFQFHARMFGAGWGVYEDPATGSAAAAFAGVLMRAEPPGDGEAMYQIEQGFEMGRPSQISLGLHVEAGRLIDATIGGSARIVCEGFIEI